MQFNTLMSSVEVISNIVLSIVYPQTVTIYEMGTTSRPDTFGNFIDAVDGSLCQLNQDPTSTDCGNITSADVLSFSYVGSESRIDSASPTYATASASWYNTRQCHEFVSP